MNRGQRLLKSAVTLHRRRFLSRSFGGLVGVLAAEKARAQNDFKMTKKQAGYVLREKSSTQICAQCIFFMMPNDCSIVQGPVSPHGWCKYYGD